MGVETSPHRLRQLLAGAPVTNDELNDINFALIASRIDVESRVARRRRLRRRGSRSLIFAGLVLVSLNFLICGAYLLLSLVQQAPAP